MLLTYAGLGGEWEWGMEGRCSEGQNDKVKTAAFFHCCSPKVSLIFRKDCVTKYSLRASDEG
jgi:hypothetical protein